MVPIGFMGTLAVTQHKRKYGDLNVFAIFLYLAAGISATVGVLLLLSAGAREGQYFAESVMYACMAFGVGLGYVGVAAFIRLAVHIADDVYMMRLIAQNDYRQKQQKS